MVLEQCQDIKSLLLLVFHQHFWKICFNLDNRHVLAHIDYLYLP